MHKLDMVFNDLDPLSSSKALHGSYMTPGQATRLYDEVFPRLIMGEKSVASNLDILQSLRVTHVVNCCYGTNYGQCRIPPDFYNNVGIQFHGIDLEDMPHINIKPYLLPAADFMHKGIGSGGVVFVHCFMGVSRSSTVVLGYLMLCQKMRLLDAARLVHSSREIYPNPGFVRQAVHSRPGTTFHLRQMKTGRMRHVCSPSFQPPPPSLCADLLATFTITLT
ncbi:hypothetical protein C0Q70_18842 [Pomacea canaliculata]|uniref:Dual specificity protein phosphatase n=1 Tax=Pomacea canaliculata TaxID=400727 RepID=A0A2T7NHN9_POMCA|nr:hypothetical protein C0Q70_18842 [Pomacea canaliculata]